jgi:hypothetical protein
MCLLPLAALRRDREHNVTLKSNGDEALSDEFLF